MKTVAIAGTGLIGASFGLALRSAGFDGVILGVSSPTAVKAAVAVGAIDRGASLEEAAGQADLVFLAQTIGRIIDTLRRLDPLVKPGVLVTDAGSTKCEITDVGRERLRRAQFLGGHPMAGKEKRGASEASASLFQNQTWVLTPDDPAELETPAAKEFRGWLGKIGARIVSLDSDAHDRVVACTSHVPQLASTALASMVAARVTAGESAIAGSGLTDMTRLALSSYDIWRDILATNSGHIERALGFYIQELEHIRENLRTRELQQEFAKGAEFAGLIRRRK
jgi:prephenate dehydrogenase